MCDSTERELRVRRAAIPLSLLLSKRRGLLRRGSVETHQRTLQRVHESLERDHSR